MTEGGRFPGTRLEWTQGTKLMHIRVPRGDWDVLHEIGERRGLKIGEVVREALREYCERAVSDGSD